MKPILNNPFGYKICYTEKPLKNQYVTRFIVHSFRRAMRIKRMYVAKKSKKRYSMKISDGSFINYSITSR